MKEQRGKLIKAGLRYVLAFIAAALVLTLFPVLTAMIPRDAIREHTLESAEYLCEKYLFEEVIPDVPESKIDHYADAILLGIAWQYDAEHPLTSVMLSAYYRSEEVNVAQSLLAAVKEGKAANLQYLRYWHGSIALVRPALCLLSLQGICRLNAVLLVLLGSLLLFLLIRRKYYALAAGLAAGAVACSVWFVPMSLEYTWTFLLMLLFSLIILEVQRRKREEYAGILFMLFGMLTVWMDFLTTETLTLTIPLLILLAGESRKGNKCVRTALRCVLAWGAGYVLFWCMKWLLAGIVLGENVMPYVAEHVSERLGGLTEGIELDAEKTPALVLGRNIGCMLPFSLGGAGVAVGAGMLMLFCYFAFVYRKQQIVWERVLCYAAMGIIPWIRYLILRNHAGLHYFFTYRAQLVLWPAALMILGEMGVFSMLVKMKSGRKKK